MGNLYQSCLKINSELVMLAPSKSKCYDPVSYDRCFLDKRVEGIQNFIWVKNCVI